MNFRINIKKSACVSKNTQAFVISGTGSNQINQRKGEKHTINKKHKIIITLIKSKRINRSVFGASYHGCK